MDLSKIVEKINQRPNMATKMGMVFHSTPEPDTCGASMRVDESSRQPMGYLSGGASLALAETLAGAGSAALCPDKVCVGIQVSGSHVRAVPDGDTVNALARIVHQGATLHVWNVDLTDGCGRLISTAHVTNYILPSSTESSQQP
ncbi:MAG: PaaI family thioesterase [Prevotella sp.]|nr:PaaI family thioesterase [Prevotella sp.]